MRKIMIMHVRYKCCAFRIRPQQMTRFACFFFGIDRWDYIFSLGSFQTDLSTWRIQTDSHEIRKGSSLALTSSLLKVLPAINDGEFHMNVVWDSALILLFRYFFVLSESFSDCLFWWVLCLTKGIVSDDAYVWSNGIEYMLLIRNILYSTIINCILLRSYQSRVIDLN